MNFMFSSDFFQNTQNSKSVPEWGQIASSSAEIGADRQLTLPAVDRHQARPDPSNIGPLHGHISIRFFHKKSTKIHKFLFFDSASLNAVCTKPIYRSVGKIKEFIFHKNSFLQDSF